MIRLSVAFALSLAPALAAADGMTIVTLGARGGIEDGNLSAFLIHPAGDPRGVTCDAGALVAGLNAAEAAGAFDGIAVPEDSEYTRVGHVLTEVVKGYFVSHAHLDHVAGLIVASPDDSAKPIYGLSSVLQNISSTYFNWVAWPNFATTGPSPLGKYELTELVPGEAIEVADTAMRVTAWPLAHGPVESTAFLFEAGEDAVLCLGDTGPDRVEEGDNLRAVWEAVAPLAASGALKAIIIEASYTSDRPDDLLFGHLTPALIHAEMAVLDGLAGDGALEGLDVIISHTKFVLKKGPLAQDLIGAELEAGDTLGLAYHMPEQGMAWTFGGE
ncbi:MAG: 3',5'-cyclic-nucleotide phosphodiesterase [Jannaschia sp.]